jgi:hypothetical protein
MPSAEIAFFSKTGLSMMLLLQHSSVNEGGKPTIKWRRIDAALNVIFHHMLWFSFVERNLLMEALTHHLVSVYVWNWFVSGI